MNRPPTAPATGQDQQLGELGASDMIDKTAKRRPARGLANSKYLRPADLARLKNYFFSSKRAVEGLYTGRHASAQRGQSVEFNDYRQYMPGDEMADIDWKVYGRSDKLFVKLFEHQSDLTVNLLIDASASMAYRGVGQSPKSKAKSFVRALAASATGQDTLSAKAPSKFDHAAKLAAAIAFMAIRQQDRISFGLGRNGLAGFAPAAGSYAHLATLLDTLQNADPAGNADLAEAIRNMAALIGRRGVLIVFSDLLDDVDNILPSLSFYTHRGGEVILFHVLHPDELRLPDIDSAMFTDSETRQRITLDVTDLRQAYSSRLHAFLDRWTSACRRRAIDYNLVSTATDYRAALERYLFSRTGLT